MNQYFCTNTGGCNSCPTPQAAQPCSCGCREDFRTALNLLCCPQTGPLINFSAAGFVSESFLIGTAIEAPVVTTAPADNLTTLTGTFVCGSSSCETAGASGALAFAAEGAAPVTVNLSQASLCQLDAIAFTAAAGATEDDLVANFQALTQLLSQLLNPNQQENCCCTTIAGSLLNSTVARSVTLTAGPLLLTNVTVLGQVGNILVLSNSTDFRIYLVCADKIAFLG